MYVLVYVRALLYMYVHYCICDCHVKNVKRQNLSICWCSLTDWASWRNRSAAADAQAQEEENKTHQHVDDGNLRQERSLQSTPYTLSGQ